ncbi:MAG: hypothetical protein KKD33_01300 [Verrucomicrobia bacterium]|nr:hypothetical protein [Verrucomicrobiota bacterium]
MTPTQTVAYHLTLMGPISLWIAVPLCVAAAIIAIWSLRRELAGRGRQGRRPWLLGLRVGTAVILVFLALQPVLFVRRETQKPAPVLIVADRSLSMLRTDAYETTDLLDIVTSLGLQDNTSRMALPLQVHARLFESRAQLQRARQTMQTAYDQLSQGLPLGAAFSRLVEEERQRAAGFLGTLPKDLQQITALETNAVLQTAAASNQLAASQAIANLLRVASAFLEALPGDSHQLPPSEQIMVILRQYAEQLRACDQAMPALLILQQRCDQTVWQKLPDEKRKGIADVAKLSRFELARRLTQRLSASTDLAQNHSLRLAGWEPLDPANAASETDLFDSIDTAITASAKERLSALVLVTDGCQNLPERPDVMRRLSACKTPLILAGVGRITTEPDVAILDYSCPRLVLAQKKGNLKVVLKTCVPAGTPIKVDIQADGQSLAEQNVQADGNNRLNLDLEFRVPSEIKTPAVLTARTEAADAFPDNNSVRIGMHILQRPIPALVIARAPRWDLVYLLRALAREPCAVRKVFWGTAKQTPATEKQENLPLPGGLTQLQPYRLVILDGESWPGMSTQSVAIFKDFVIKEGGSLLILTDEQGLSIAPLLSGLLGDAPAPAITVIPASRPNHLQPTHAARLLPVISLSADGARSMGMWREFPSPAHVHAVNSQTLPLLVYGTTPCLSLGFYGRGRIYQLGIGDLFRMREWNSGAALNRFLASLLEDSLAPLFAEPSANLTLYPSTPLVGSMAYVLVQGASGGTIQVTFPDRRTNEVALARSAGGDLAMASLRIPAEGLLELRTTDGRLYATQTLAPIMSENLATGLDGDFLTRLANQAGGSFVPLPDLESKIRAIPVKVNCQVDLREWPLWNLTGVLLLLLVWIIVEWIMRRRAGLVL